MEHCDKEGRYRFFNIPPGQYELYVMTPSRWGPPCARMSKVVVEAGKVVVCNYTFEQKYSISGRVTDQSGKPVSGTEVEAYWDPPEGMGQFINSVATDSEGRYTIRGPSPVAGLLQFDGMIDSTRNNVRSGRKDVDYVLGRTWSWARDGLRVWLMPDKKTWAYGEAPTFKGGVRSCADSEFFVLRIEQFHEVGVDGHRSHYRWGDWKWENSWDGHVAETSRLEPGETRLGITLSLDNRWGEPLKQQLTPGKHRIRVSVLARLGDAARGKLVRATSKPVEIEILPVPASQPEESVSFGPVIERVVYYDSSGQDRYIDFETGRLFSMAAEMDPRDGKARKEWIVANGIDAEGLPDGDRGRLASVDLMVQTARDEWWDSFPRMSLQEFSLRLMIASPLVMTSTGEPPATFQFQTREGGMGILQIVGFSEEPKGVRIRYKMVKAPRGRGRPEARKEKDGVPEGVQAVAAIQPAPSLRWVDSSSGNVLFTVDDIVRFDWTKQLFELERERAIDLMMLPRALRRDFAVVDDRGTAYTGCFMSAFSSFSYDGPTILLGPPTKPPLYEIEGGYPGGGGARDKDRFHPRLHAALEQAGVLKDIDPARPPAPIRTSFSGWHGGKHGLKIAVMLVPETFRMGRDMRLELRFGKSRGGGFVSFFGPAAREVAARARIARRRGRKDEGLDVEPEALSLRITLQCKDGSRVVWRREVPLDALNTGSFAFAGGPRATASEGPATLEIELAALRRQREDAESLEVWQTAIDKRGGAPSQHPVGWKVLCTWKIPPQAVQILPPGEAQGPAWGEAVEGLRCRWVKPTELVVAGTAPMIALEVENVSSEVVFWRARSGSTWYIPVRGSTSGRSFILPEFEVRPERGCRRVSVDEARSHHRGPGDAIGYFALEPGGRLTMVTEYPWILEKPGQLEIAGHIDRRSTGGGGYVVVDGEVPVDPNRVTFPPLVLEAVPGSADAARAYEIIWSDPVDGLQVGITYEYGKRPTAHSRWTALSFRMRNVSDKPITLWRCPTAYDEEPRPVVLDEGGRKQRVELVSDGSKDPLVKHTLKPGDRWSGGSAGFAARPRNYTGTKTTGPILYADPGKYTLTHTFRYNLDGSDRPNKQVTVGPIEIEIVAAHDKGAATQPLPRPNTPPWGEPVDGLQVRLRAEKRVWKSGEIPTVKADLRNRGTTEALLRPSQSGHIGLNGQWHLLGTSMPHWVKIFLRPGESHEGYSFRVDERLFLVRGRKLIRVAPGNHTIRVAFEAKRKDEDEAFRVISNPVEIEVLPEHGGLSFGPVIERVLEKPQPSESPLERAYLDFQTGKVFIAPQEVMSHKEALGLWQRSEGIDAGIRWYGGNKCRLMGVGAVMVQTSNDGWQSMTPRQLRNSEELSQRAPVFGDADRSELVPPTTYLFKTRDGAIGILQILAVVDTEPRGARVRYKMVQGSSEARPSGPDLPSAPGEEKPDRGRLSGRVVNAVTGEPISGAYVAIDRSGDAGGANLERFRAQGVHATAETGEDGSFVLGGLAFMDNHPLMVAAPGYVRHTRTVAVRRREPVRRLDVALQPGGRIMGRVVDNDGRGMAGITVRLEAADGRLFWPMRADWPGYPWRDVKTDAEGQFSFGELNAGIFHVDALQAHVRPWREGEKPGLTETKATYIGSVQNIEVGPGQVTEVQLSHAGESGRILLSGDVPSIMPGGVGGLPAMAILSRDVGPLDVRGGPYHLEDPRLGRIMSAKLVLIPFDSEGHAEFSGLPAGTYAIYVVTIEEITSPTGQKHAAAFIAGEAVDLAPGQQVQSQIEQHEVKTHTVTVQKLSFDPVIERFVHDDGEKKDFLIDLDTGRLYSPYPHLAEAAKDEVLAWIAENGIDATGETAAGVRGLGCLDMAVAEVENQAWTMPPEKVATQMASAKSTPESVMSAKDGAPVTFAFKTREGAIGILQILEVVDIEPRGMWVRYKMIRSSFATPASPHP